MPHKFKRNGKWTGQWYGQVKWQGQRKRSSLMDSKEDAQAWEVDMRRHLAGQGADPTPQPTAMVSVIEWANRYLDYSQRYAPKTYSEKKNVMKRLVKALGKETLVVSITPAKALEHIQEQYQKRSGYAANKERKNLSAAWEWGMEFLDGFPDGKNPFKKRKALTFPATKHPRYVPPESDFWRVVGKAEGQDKVLLLTLIFTGARIGELFRLRWSDVDFIERRISLTTKKRENGSMEADWIPMTDALFDVLLEHSQNTSGEWVFVQQEGRNKGRQIKEYRGFPKELCKKAEVKPFDNHGIRHLTASVLARNSVPQVVIKNILRHKSLRMSDRYVHGPEDMRPYLGVLEGGLSNLEVQHEVQQ